MLIIRPNRNAHLSGFVRLAPSQTTPNPSPEASVDRVQNEGNVTMEADSTSIGSSLTGNRSLEPGDLQFLRQTFLPPKAYVSWIQLGQRYDVLKPDEVKVDPDFVFTPEEKEALENFRMGLQFHQSQLLTTPGLGSSNIISSLVFLKPESTVIAQSRGLNADGETRIRIFGMRKLKNIRKFHKIVSANGFKRFYHPMKLCYQKLGVYRTALAECAIQQANTQTLCGRLMILERPDSGPQTSTIGGLLRVQNSLFALTTNHSAEDEDDSSDSEHESDDNIAEDSVIIFDDEAGFHEFGREFAPESPGKSDEYTFPPKPSMAATQPKMPEHGKTKAIKFEDMAEITDSAGTKAKSLSQIADEGYSVRSMEESAIRSGDDWCLVPMQSQDCLPNKIPVSPRSLKLLKGKPPLIEDYCREILPVKSPLKINSPRPVWILSGISGFKRGRLCSKPFVMFSAPGGPKEVWMILVKDLQAGDSGSWVLDEADRRVLGILTARATGMGFITSFQSVRKSIASSLAVELNSIKLPSRLDREFRVQMPSSIQSTSSHTKTSKSMDNQQYQAYDNQDGENKRFEKLLKTLEAGLQDTDGRGEEANRTEPPEVNSRTNYLSETISAFFISMLTSAYNPETDAGPTGDTLAFAMIAITYMGVVVALQTSSKSDVVTHTSWNMILLPSISLLFWLLAELELYWRPARPGRRDLRRSLCRHMRTLFFGILLGTFMGTCVSFAVRHWRQLDFSDFVERYSHVIRLLKYFGLMPQPRELWSYCHDAFGWVNETVYEIPHRLNQQFNLNGWLNGGLVG